MRIVLFVSIGMIVLSQVMMALGNPGGGGYHSMGLGIWLMLLLLYMKSEGMHL
jgi:hypothetical protein